MPIYIGMNIMRHVSGIELPLNTVHPPKTILTILMTTILY